MKIILLLTVFLLSNLTIVAQNVGINTNTPQVTLDVNGTILAGGRSAIDHIGTLQGDEGIIFPGPTSDYIISVQDGNGRIQHKWNASCGVGERFLVGGEDAFFMDIDVNVNNDNDAYFTMKHSNGAAAAVGTPITWNSHFAVTQGGNIGLGINTPGSRLHLANVNPSLIETIRIEDMAVTTTATNNAELATTTTTTNKAVYVDNNGDLKSRYAYGDNTQSVVLSGASQDITSTSLTDITGASITFTPRHAVVYLSFAISGYNPLNSTPQQSWFVVGVDKDGTTIGNFLSLSATQDNGAASGAATIAAGHYPITVTPGVPVTIKLRGRRGGTNSNLGFRVDKTNYTSYMTIWD